MKLRLSATALALTALAVGGYASAQGTTATQHAGRRQGRGRAEPDGGADDAGWATAKPLSVNLSGGANFGGKGSTTATLKAVYTGDMLYMLVQYADPTELDAARPVPEAGRRLVEEARRPGEQGRRRQRLLRGQVGDALAHQQLGQGLRQEGLRVACHVGEGKPYGNKYTAQRGRDRRHVAHEGQPHRARSATSTTSTSTTRATTRRRAPTPAARATRAAPSTATSKVVNGKPEFMNKDAKAGQRRRHVLHRQGRRGARSTTAKFKAGDEVASYLIYPLKGDRADIKVANSWNNGVLHLGGEPQARHRQQVRRAVQRPGREVSVRLRRVRQRAGAPRGALRPRVPELREVAAPHALDEGGLVPPFFSSVAAPGGARGPRPVSAWLAPP